MSKVDAAKYAGSVLRKLIKENYASQEEFANDFGVDLRRVSDYVNKGINKLNLLQQLAEHFHVNLKDFIPSTEEKINTER